MIPLSPHSSHSVLLTSPDAELRQRLREGLTGLRWVVHEATGGAEALMLLESRRPEAMLMDHWLPDLEAAEFAGQVAREYPGLDLLRMDGGAIAGARSSRRHELLHVLRGLPGSESSQQPSSGTSFRPQPDTPAWAAAPVARRSGMALASPVPPLAVAPPASAAPATEPVQGMEAEAIPGAIARPTPPRAPANVTMSEAAGNGPAASAQPLPAAAISTALAKPRPAAAQPPIPGLVGSSAPMQELAGMIRLVASRSSRVLIEGETGTGKEVVAQAIHRMSPRARKPLVVLNCAALPEALLEAELFGHTRGAFTGAVQGRTGRIEAAEGGTLFLDEIGELPLTLQAKMLRFLESGELQRIGENETMRVDVRILAATHQPLEQRAAEGSFRLDLFHRLSVFPIDVPPLRDRLEDLPALAEHLLARLGKEAPQRRLRPEALDALFLHSWPGNVRELAHVLERATILAAEAPEIGVEHIRFRRRPRG